MPLLAQRLAHLGTENAFKLGEDIAASDEILLTREAHEQLSEEEQGAFERNEIMVSGITLIAFKETVA